ncbi:glycosyltransferase family 2 protein [Arthrobacter sp.]|uniref:glycosyltransferase family 2 protein n=1 Tax=Arthrobacter sp. TaxID=1667 RepID=UPI003A9037D2
MNTSLTIAVLTYHRLDRLPRTVESLLQQIDSLPTEVQMEFDCRVLIVDNAPVSEASEIVALRPGTIDYQHEPRPGISAARNRAVDESPDSALLIFVDDDIVPLSGWLEQMLLTWKRFNCEAVVGYVVSTFERDPDPWLVSGRFFMRQQHATGTELSAAASHNLLLFLPFVRKHKLRFNESLGLIGGEDSLFSKEMIRHGGSIRWCNEARSQDPVPNDRATRGWVRRREFRIGSSEALITLFLASERDRLRKRAWCFINGVGRVVFGGIRNVLGKLTSNLDHESRGARTVFRGGGYIIGSLGLTYFEYGRGKRGIRRVPLDFFG